MTSTLAMDARRHIAVRGLFNLRDVGGYRTRDGGTTRWRTLLRSDAPHRLTDDCRATLGELGVRHAVDLRTAAERDRAPAAWDHSVRSVHRPILSTVEGELTLEGLYEEMTGTCGRALALAVTELSRTAGTPTVVHCSAGKDRTGLVIALVLATVGVADDDIVADYALTARYLNEGTADAVQQLRGADRGHALNPGLLACPPELLEAALARVRRDAGCAREFLVRHGTSPADLDRLGHRLVE